jgi:signal transduction histidine kinase
MNDQVKNSGDMNFSVDAELLRELGERLVGKPDIALAELVKNSYDADATTVEIIFGKNSLEIIDNGHGMTLKDLENLWLRVGSTHKVKIKNSKKFKRPLTGSKGIGRLAVQFLAHKIEMRTVYEKETVQEVVATLDWDEAIASRDLIKASVAWKRIKRQTIFPENKKYGTRILLSGLKQSWTEKELIGLAKEIWALQPPFKPNTTSLKEKRIDFKVGLKGVDQRIVKKFDSQMAAAFQNWEAKITGKLFPPENGSSAKAKIIVDYENGRKIRWEYETDDLVNELEFEVRIFRLKGNQKRGVLVEEAREYIKEFGGVHIYDAGFHLPYYGPDTDWLNIERDHAARIGGTELLPKSLQTSRALNALPSQRRIFGMVYVNTSREKRTAQGNKKRSESKYLQIQLTRDRLVNNEAYRSLANTVRTALDFYANETQKILNEEAKKKDRAESTKKSLKSLDEILELYKNRIPKDVFKELKFRIEQIAEISEGEAEKLLQDTELLGPLATAGITAVAFDHELNKQLAGLEEVSKEVSSLSVKDRLIEQRLKDIGAKIDNWIKRARSTRKLFSPLLNEENRESKRRFKAKPLVKEVSESLGQFMRGVTLDLSNIEDDLRLPSGSFAQWYAVFQNVLINAVNAMLDSEEKLIWISSNKVGRTMLLYVQDTGSGVNLKNSDRLFEPFERKSKISSERKRLGYGGTGLGLTIVKMIANNVNTRVKFTEPGEGFSTAFQISWSEEK